MREAEVWHTEGHNRRLEKLEEEVLGASSAGLEKQLAGPLGLTELGAVVDTSIVNKVRFVVLKAEEQEAYLRGYHRKWYQTVMRAKVLVLWCVCLNERLWSLLMFGEMRCPLTQPFSATEDIMAVEEDNGGERRGLMEG
jgi:hypothetical protein